MIDSSQSAAPYHSLIPMQPRPWYEEALRLVKADYYPAALEATNKAIGIEPGHAKAHRLRGLALSELDRHEEALDAYRQAIKLDPAMTYVQYQIAVELNRLGRHAEALAAADTSIGFNPDDTAPFILRGAILFDLGRYPEALDAFTSVLERRPDVWQVRFNRAHALDHARHLCELAGAKPMGANTWESANLRAVASCALGDAKSGADLLRLEGNRADPATRELVSRLYDLLSDPPMPGIDQLRAVAFGS